MGAKKLKASKENRLVLKFFGLSIISGIFLFLPFLHYYTGWLVLVTLLPFFYLLSELAKHQLKRKTTFAYIWLSGWVMFLGVTFWLLQTQPDRWAGTTGWWSIGLLVLVYLLMTLLLSVGFVLFGIGWSLLRLNFSQKRIFLVLPALWVACEWARSWLFSIVSFGPNTSLGMHWNFADLGFAVSVTPLVFLGRFGGLLGLSFVVVIINLCIFWIIQKRWKLPLLILAGITILTFISWWIYKTPNPKTINVAALQIGSNSNLQIGSIDYHEKLSGLVKPNSIDLLVMSEYSDIFNQQSLKNDTDFAKRSMTNSEAPIITSRQRSVNNNNYNTITVYNQNANITYEYDKQFLIPIGEAMPYALRVLMKVTKQDNYISVREVTRGNNAARAYTSDGLRLGSLACSGAISPELYRYLVKDNAQILTNSASLSIFEKAVSYHTQAQQMARFMAVANARPFVQATDGSYSFVLDSNGQWLSKSGQKEIQLLQSKINLNNQRTIYTILGEWFVFISLLIITVQIIYINRK
jgi:apolipoprotein N-acyltransferase